MAKKQNILIFGAAAVIVALFLGFLYIGQVKTPPDSTPTTITGKTMLDVTGEPSVGPKDAPVTIVVFNDFTSDYGRSVHLYTLKYAKEDYVEEGKARIVYKDFPFSKESVMVAEAAQCAHEQGKFLEVANAIYKNRAEWINATNYMNFIRTYAAGESLDMAKFDQCVETRKYKDEVTADRKEGLSIGVSYTPAAYVNEQKVNTVIYAYINEMIKKEIAKLNQTRP